MIRSFHPSIPLVTSPVIPLAVGLISLCQAATIPLNNGNFNSGSGTTASNWTQVDGSGTNSSPSNYWANGGAVPGIATGAIYIKSDGNNRLQQAFSSSDLGAVNATTFGDYTIAFDCGYRHDSVTNGSHTIRVSLWNVTDNAELAGSDLVIADPGVGTNALTSGSFHLTYDNSAANLAGDSLAIRFTSTSGDLGGNAWQRTAILDNVVLTASSVPVAPTIVTQPAAATVSEFGSHTFSVQASGSPTLTYQWKKGTQVLDGQTNATLTLSNLSSTDAGSYSVTVTNPQGSAESNSAALTVDSYSRDVTGASGLLARILPGQSDRFIIEFVAPENGKDVFEIESRGEKTVLRGNTSVSVASALNRYLTEYCHCHVSRNGDQLALPAPLPLVPGKLRVVSPHRVRFFYNPCTFGYTSAWWGWDKWEREIDMLALQGVNVAQVTPGIEEVLRRTLCDHFGYTDAEVRGWLCHPSHLPWMLLSNMHSFAGPVSDSLVDNRAVLGRQICDRMRSLGMAPMVQGFYGMVPQDFKTRFPAADVRTQGNWAGGFERPNMLNPTDPVFDTFTTHYAQALTAVYGPVKFLAADPFHEGGNTSGINLAAASQAVLAGISKVDPQATWVLEAWGNNPIQTMLDAVDKQRLLVLDLNCTTTENWRSRNAFGQTPWVWCAIMNFGGNTGMDAALSKLASMPASALADANRGPMAGVGMMPEGSSTIPAAYDLLFSHSWTATAPNLTGWVRDYARRRYGMSNTAIENAWDLRLQATDNPGAGEQEPHNSIICARPGLSTSLRARTWASTNIPYAPQKLAASWEKMLDAVPQAGTSDAYRFDLADTARQVLCDLATRHQRLLADAVSTNNAAAAHAHGDRILEIIADLDTLCATRREWLLGTWLSDARSWGGTAAEKDLCERNARLLLTTWGASVSDLNDYANREWSGLLSGFYRPRWQQFLAALYASVDQGASFNESAVRSQIGTWELNWTNSHEAYPATTSGDTITVATALWAKYGAEAQGYLDMTSFTVGNTWSPAICSATAAQWTRPATEINAPGVWCLTFQYTSGSHALQISDVALNDGATLIERDIHSGWTGSATYDNRYYFRVNSVPANPSLTIIANSAGGTNSNGTITLSRCDVADIDGTWTPAVCSTSRKVWRMDASGLVTGNGVHTLSASFGSGSSALTIDRAWIEQSGVIRAVTVADETLSAAGATASWALDVKNYAPGQPATLFIATGSATSAGSNGTLVLTAPVDGTATDTVSWQRWAAGHGLDATNPDHDSDGDGVSDLIEFLTTPDSATQVHRQPLQLGLPDQLTLRMAGGRAGAVIRIESSANLESWNEDTSLQFLSEDTAPDGTLSRSYQLPALNEKRFYRFHAVPTP